MTDERQSEENRPSTLTAPNPKRSGTGSLVGFLLALSFAILAGGIVMGIAPVRLPRDVRRASASSRVPPPLVTASLLAG